MSLLCSYEKIITHFNTISEVVYLSSNNMHFDCVGGPDGRIKWRIIGQKNNIWNKGECLSLWFLGTRITSALLCHCLQRLSPLTPAWNNFLLLRKSLLGIRHGRSRWTWVSVQTYKERRRKRNNNKLNRFWTTTASQVSWISAMNSKLNWSGLHYWQRDMLIVLIICAVFHGATSMNNSQTLLLIAWISSDYFESLLLPR